MPPHFDPEFGQSPGIPGGLYGRGELPATVTEPSALLDEGLARGPQQLLGTVGTAIEFTTAPPRQALSLPNVLRLGDVATEQIESTPIEALRRHPDLTELESQLAELEALFPPADRTKEAYSLSRNEQTCEVRVNSGLTREDYKRVTPDFVWEMEERELDELVAEAYASGRPRVLLEAGATYTGGGVAKLVPQFIHKLNLKGRAAAGEDSAPLLEAHWLTSASNDPRYATTKKLHNLQQNVLGEGVHFTDEDKQVHQALGLDFFDSIKDSELLQKATDFIFDDFQLVAAIPPLLKAFPHLKIYVRNHINTNRDLMDQEGTPQHDIREYLHHECGVDLANTYIAHPVPGFIPSDIDTPGRVAMIPPPMNPLAELDMPLTKTEQVEQLTWVDGQLQIQNLRRQLMWAKHFNLQFGEGNWPVEWMHQDDQQPMDWTRKQLTGWARPDFAKCQWINMEVQARVVDIARQRGLADEDIPVSNVFGQGASDDTDTQLVLGRLFRLQNTRYAAYRDFIRIGCFDHSYKAPNAVTRQSMFTAHFAKKEGFEHYTSEGATKENPEDEPFGNIPMLVVAQNGLAIQLEEGVNGHGLVHIENIVDNGDSGFDPYVVPGSALDAEVTSIAERIVEYAQYPDKYEALRASTHELAKTLHHVEFGPGANMVRLGRVLNGKVGKKWRMSELRPEYFAQAA